MYIGIARICNGLVQEELHLLYSYIAYYKLATEVEEEERMVTEAEEESAMATIC